MISIKILWKLVQYLTAGVFVTFVLILTLSGMDWLNKHVVYWAWMPASVLLLGVSMYGYSESVERLGDESR